MNYQDKKLTVTAYNTTKGHAIGVDTTNGKNYFTLSCSTQYNDQNAVGDSISIVAYLTGNAAVSATKTVKISNIYTDEFSFDSVKLGDAARVTINGTYEIEYTAKDSEGNSVTLDKPVSVPAWKSGVLGGTPKHTTSDLTFISSNPSAVNVDDFEITTDGKLKFTAGSTDGTAIITAINNQTGKSTNITIKVNKKPVASSVEVADASIAANTSTGTGKVKAAVTVYDQFGDVIPVANCKNLSLSTMDISYTPSGFVSIQANISGDGKYLVYDVSQDLSSLKGQTIVTTFTSKNAGETGYIKSTASLEVSDEALPASISVNAAPALSKVAGETTDFKFAVKDQYGNEMTGTAVTNAGFTLVVTDPQKVFDAADTTIVGDIGANKEYKHTFTAQNPGADLHKSGVVTLSLLDENDNVVSKVSYTVDAVTAPTKYVVNADKTSYTAGDEATITVEAYASTQFNNYYNADVAAKVVAGSKTYTTTLKFVNGSASYKLKLVDSSTTEIIVTNIANSVTTASADASDFTINAGGVAGLSVSTTGQAIVADAAGTTVGWYSGDKVATFKVEDLTLSSDITGSCTWGSTLNSDNTLIVTFTGGKTNAALPTVTLPTVNKTNTIKITVTIEGVSYSQTLTGTAGAHTIGAASWT